MTVIATVALTGGYDVDLSTKNHIALIDEAAASGAELVVFPEISLQGYPPDFASFYPERIRAAFESAESVPDGPHVQAIAEHAQEVGVYVCRRSSNSPPDEQGVQVIPHLDVHVIPHPSG
jgi:predicted amidohydrolase